MCGLANNKQRLRKLLEHRLYEYFEYKWDPELKGKRIRRIDECIDQIMDDLEQDRHRQ